MPRPSAELRETLGITRHLPSSVNRFPIPRTGGVILGITGAWRIIRRSVVFRIAIVGYGWRNEAQSVLRNLPRPFRDNGDELAPPVFVMPMEKIKEPVEQHRPVI